MNRKSNIGEQKNLQPFNLNLYNIFLVSECGLACQQEISLVLAKTPPIHY